MELVIMETNRDRKYRKARRRVKDIKDFYTHLTVYVVVNLFIIAMHLGIFQSGFANVEIPDWSIFTTPFFWGIGLFFHWLKVFKNNNVFLKNWEKRKIQEYLDKEEEEINKFNRN